MREGSGSPLGGDQRAFYPIAQNHAASIPRHSDQPLGVTHGFSEPDANAFRLMGH